MEILKWWCGIDEERVDSWKPKKCKEYYGKEFNFRSSSGEVLEIGVCGVNELNKCEKLDIKEKLFKNLMNNKYLYRKYECSSVLTGCNYIHINNIKTIDNTTHSDDGWDVNTIVDIIYISGDNIEDVNMIYNFLNKTDENKDNNYEINNEDNKMKIKEVLMDFSCTIPIGNYEYKIKVYFEKDNNNSYNVEISKKPTLYSIDELGTITEVKKRLNKYEREWLEKFINIERKNNNKDN